jgi:hypothetical protein
MAAAAAAGGSSSAAPSGPPGYALLRLGLDELVAAEHPLATEPLIPAILDAPASQQLAPAVLYVTWPWKLLSTDW